MKAEPSSVDEKLTAISRGLFINRCLLIFLATGVGILLFAPSLAADLAAACESTGKAVFSASNGLVGIGIALVAVVFCAAYIVSKIAPSAPAPADREKY